MRAEMALKFTALFLLMGVPHVAAAAESWQEQSGLASTYSQNGGITANGEISNTENLTAAHPTLPFGTRVLVTNGKNGHSVVVRINDRGPFTKGRVIDLTPAAAQALGFSGLTHVTLSLAADTTLSTTPNSKEVGKEPQ